MHHKTLCSFTGAVGSRQATTCLGLVSVWLFALCPASFAQAPQTGRLDFLQSKDPSFALFANTSNTSSFGVSSPVFPNELVLVTGLPASPEISARIDVLGKVQVCSGCGGLRNVALSPDGDSALLSSEPSSAQAPKARMDSVLFLLRNVRAFARSKDPADLKIRRLAASEFPQLDNVSGVVFGPDGHWAVVNTGGPGYLDLTGATTRGTIVLITGLPDNPVLSVPFDVPMHSLGNIDLSLDGDTLLLNDTTDGSGGSIKANVIAVQGIRPGNSPRIASIATVTVPPGTPPGPPPVRDARFTLDGRFIIAPIPMISAINAKGSPVPMNQIAILGPVRDGKLDTARLLTEADGVQGGPYQAGISPDGDSALVGEALTVGGANLLTGLDSGDPARIQVRAVAPFPVGVVGSPPVAAHGQSIFTPDGDSALVVNFISPAMSPSLTPSLTVMTGFRSGNIHVAATLSNRTFNPFDNRQQVATVPSGLMDYVNLYVPAGASRNDLASLLNEAVAGAVRGDTVDSIVNRLVSFIRSAKGLVRQGALSASKGAVLSTLAAVGVQVLIGHTENVSSASFRPGPVSPSSLATLSGTGFTAVSGPTVTVIDSLGTEHAVAVSYISPNQINYSVPGDTAFGKAIALVSTGDHVSAIAALSVEPISPALFTKPDGKTAAAVIQTVRPDGTQTVETVTGPIDLSTATDQVFLVLFGTGIRGHRELAEISAIAGPQTLQVLYAGPQGAFAGLDQVNVLLPRSLSGAGLVDITFSIDGWNSNTVQVEIR